MVVVVVGGGDWGDGRLCLPVLDSYKVLPSYFPTQCQWQEPKFQHLLMLLTDLFWPWRLPIYSACSVFSLCLFSDPAGCQTADMAIGFRGVHSACLLAHCLSSLVSVSCSQLLTGPELSCVAV